MTADDLTPGTPRPARVGDTVTTAAELDVLPVGSVVRDRFGDDAGKLVVSGRWNFPETAPLSAGYVAKHYAPLTVLFRPDAPQPDTTDDTVERAAREYVHRQHNPTHDRGVGIAQGSHYRTGFVDGAIWQHRQTPALAAAGSENSAPAVLASDDAVARARRWLANYHGSIDATALLLAHQAGQRAALAAAGAGAEVITRAEAERMVAVQSEMDRAMYEAYRPEVVAEVAVQLSEETDWDAVAKWCGGTIRTGQEPSGEYVSDMLIPGVGTAWQGAWIVQRHDLTFAIRAEVEGPSPESAALLPARGDATPTEVEWAIRFGPGSHPMSFDEDGSALTEEGARQEVRENAGAALMQRDVHRSAWREVEGGEQRG